MKEFFHNEGIHSTTIQPEFVETGGGDPSNASITSADDCMLACPKVSERCQMTFYFKTRNTNNLVEWAADSPISYWYLGGQYLGQPTSVDEPKIGRETLAILFSYPLRSAWTRVSTKDTCATKMRLSQQWLFPCLNRKENCMPHIKDLPKTD